MANKKTERLFTWLSPRADWGGGKAILETGCTYSAELFPDDVVEGWVLNGDAKWTTAKEK
jgi:hypothetical protein